MTIRLLPLDRRDDEKLDVNDWIWFAVARAIGQAGTTVPIKLSTGSATGAAPNGTINPKTGLLTVTIASGDKKITGHGAMIDATNGDGYFVTQTNAQAIQIAP